MNKEKLIQEANYLDLAKNVTQSLSDICLSKDYKLIDVLSGISIGVYMFIRQLSIMMKCKPQHLINECVQWLNWADSKFNKNN